MHDKILQVTPRPLIEDMTGSANYTKPFCDLMAEADLSWPQGGSFDNSNLTVLHEL